MAGKFPNRRIAEVHPFNENATITVNLEGSRRILHSVIVMITGKLTVTQDPSTVAPGGTANWLERLEFIYAGYDSGVDAKRTAETRISAKGRYFAYGNPQFAANSQDDGLPRLNVLKPDSPMLANNDMLKTGNLGSAAEQDIKLFFEVPFYLDDGVQPRDFHLDMSNTRSAILRLKLGKLSDAGLGANSLIGTLKDGQVTIFVEEMEVDDAIQYNGGIELPKGYMSIFDQTQNIDATTAGLRKDLQIPGNLMSLFLFCYDENGKPTDTMLNNARLESEGDGFFDATDDLIRYLNYNSYKKLAAAGNSSVNGANFFKSSGFYAIDMARDENGVHLLQSRHMGQGNNQSSLILDVTKPAGGIGKMDILTVQAHLDIEYRAATKKYKNMSPAERAIADANAVPLNRRAEQVEQRAANASIS